MAGNSRKSKVDPLLGGFEFEEGGRVFVCSSEASRSAPDERWWWFRVTPDTRGQRYAPFRAAEDDTRANVQARIVAFHDALLVRRAQPAASGHWARRPAAPAAASAPTDADVDVDVDLDADAAPSAEPAAQ